MNRKTIVFLISFLLTLGLCIGITWWLSQQQSATSEPSAPLPSQTESTPPTQKEEEDTLQQPTSESIPGEGQKPSPSPAANATDTQEQASQASKDALPQLKESPRSPQHAVALTVAELLRSNNGEQTATVLTKHGLATEEQAAALTHWMQAHQASRVEEVGVVSRPDGVNVTRFRINSQDGKSALLLDVAPDNEGRMRIIDIREEHLGQIAAAADSLATAESFIQAVQRGDMIGARALISGSDISDATVAGLCMIFEDGLYRLRPSAPIRNTFENEDRSGYLVYVISPESKAPSNIGLELQKDTGKWHVCGVALDTLLSNYEASALAEGNHYFPLVKNPKGGDSIALFFAFNEYDLTPRSLRQLRIVAELLKQNQRRLNISGHTDDIGSEGYNLKLSEKRAQAVKAALVSYGVDAAQITTQGLGKSSPRRTYSADDSEQAIDYIRGENRRAEIYLDFE